MQAGRVRGGRDGRAGVDDDIRFEQPGDQQRHNRHHPRQPRRRSDDLEPGEDHADGKPADRPPPTPGTSTGRGAHARNPLQVDRDGPHTSHHLMMDSAGRDGDSTQRIPRQRRGGTAEGDDERWREPVPHPPDEGDAALVTRHAPMPSCCRSATRWSASCQPHRLRDTASYLWRPVHESLESAVR